MLVTNKSEGGKHKEYGNGFSNSNPRLLTKSMAMTGQVH